MISQAKAAFVRGLETADGYIDPDDVVAAARAKTSPIHDEFNWNTDEAAREHWRETARRLIRFVRLETEIQNVTVIAPMYVKDPLPQSRKYVEITRANADREIAERVMVDELDRIASAIRRAQNVAAVLGLSGRLEAMLADVTRLRTRAERRAVERHPRARQLPRRRSSSRATARA